MSNLVDYDFDVTPVGSAIESATKSLIKSFKLSKVAKYTVFFLLIFGIYSIIMTILLNYNNQEEELV